MAANANVVAFAGEDDGHHIEDLVDQAAARRKGVMSPGAAPGEVVRRLAISPDDILAWTTKRGTGGCTSCTRTRPAPTRSSGRRPTTSPPEVPPAAPPWRPGARVRRGQVCELERLDVRGKSSPTPSPYEQETSSPAARSARRRTWSRRRRASRRRRGHSRDLPALGFTGPRANLARASSTRGHAADGLGVVVADDGPRPPVAARALAVLVAIDVVRERRLHKYVAAVTMLDLDDLYYDEFGIETPRMIANPELPTPLLPRYHVFDADLARATSPSPSRARTAAYMSSDERPPSRSSSRFGSLRRR